jgi:hypothetical protein
MRMLYGTEQLHSDSGYGHKCVEIEHCTLQDGEVCVMLCDLQLVQ